MDNRLTTTLGDLSLKNPVMNASGTFGYGEVYAPFFPVERLGAMITKGLTPRPRVGNEPPRIVETPSGMLNAIGLNNIGIEAFIADKLPQLPATDLPVIINVMGESVTEFVELARRAAQCPGISGLELNISCPNVGKVGLAFGVDPAMTGDLVAAVRAVYSKHLMVKLTPQAPDMLAVARSAERSGADSLSVVNTYLGMKIDIRRRKPVLSNRTGGLSGPAIRPLAVRAVYEVVRTVEIPVVGTGGIETAENALEFIMAGAKAVQVGTAQFRNPRALVDLIDGLSDYCDSQQVCIAELVGVANE